VTGLLELGVISAVFFAYALVSRGLLRWNVSAPMVFVGAGMLFGGDLLGWATFDPESSAGLLIAEAALVVVLFADAARTDLSELKSDGSLSGRLLAIGMPLTIGFGTVAGAVLLLGLDFWEAAIVAAILAPTDAALGHAVVTSKIVPEKIRQTINVEAGLNDGLSIPFLFLFLGLAADQASLDATAWFTFGIQQIVVGIAAGLLVGGAGGWLVDRASQIGAMTYNFRRLSMVALAIGSWVAADQVGGNGFIAAFVAGLAVARFRDEFGEESLGFAEREGQLLSLVVFFVFGTAAISFLGAVTWEVVAFAVLSLTILRMGPVALALAGTGLSRHSMAFIGWFGPRGLASIILALVVVDEEPGLPALDLVLAATTLTVLISVFVHGISARPLAKAYARSVADLPPSAPEHSPTDKIIPRSLNHP
jgi:NhaP-type Na+/H+ or K+/H+ antiporter